MTYEQLWELIQERIAGMDLPTSELSAVCESLIHELEGLAEMYREVAVEHPDDD